MKARHLYLWLGGAGALFLTPGLLWITTSGSPLKDDDVRIALQPLVRVSLRRISDSNLQERITVPDTSQWTKIRKVWGEPEFVISAIDETGRNLICPSIPAHIELTDRSGSVIPLRRGGPPYGYSAFCAESSLRFNAAPGDTLNISITASAGRALPAGDLIVVRDWWNTKDKLVGVYLDDDISSLIRWTSLAGVLLLAADAVLILRSQVRKRRTV
jgi:hypothetical protein